MPNKKDASRLVGILKTLGFFIVFMGLIGVGIHFFTKSSVDQIAAKDKEEFKAIDISDLSDFEYYTPLPGEKVDEGLRAPNKIPESVLNLNGKQVSITGYMMPVRVDGEGKVSEFALNGNYDMCFYGAPSKINQWVHVKMRDGVKAAFSHNATVVSGTLEVGELIEDGEVISLYRLTGDKTSSPRKRLF